MKSIWELANDSVRCLKPCVHGGKVWDAEKQTRLSRNAIIDFSSSVNPLGSSPKAIKAIRNSLEQIIDYPDSTSVLLREAIAACFTGVVPNNVVVGNGSTELIYLFAEAFLEIGETALIPAPTFGEYENAVKKAGGKVRYIELGPGFRIEPDAFTCQMQKGMKMVFLCNPNNPTSHIVSSKTLFEIITAALDEDALVFLDENFLEFVDDDKQVSLVDMIGDYPNLFVLRSFTKVFGLTGLRVGYGVASEDITELLSNVKMPWNVNCLAQAAALAALTDTEHLKKSRKLVKTERAFLSQELAQIRSFKPYHADANFILINIKESGFTSAQLAEKMLKQGILIRDCSSFIGLDSYHIRVSVKTRQENERLLEAFKKITK